MSIKRVIDTQFWNDDKVVDMFSPEDKLFFLYLMTNPHTTQLGIYKINKKIMAFELGYSVEAVAVLVERFETKYGLIWYSTQTQEIAIKNYLKHSIIKGGKPVYDLLIKEIKQVKNKKLIKCVYNSIYDSDDLNETVKSILNYINDLYMQNANDNDNDNDNDVSYYDTCNDTSLSFSPNPTPQKPIKHKYGEHKNVLLTDEEYKKLQERFPTDYDEKINTLSEGLALKGYKYKSHYLAVLKWAKNDESKAVKTTASSNPFLEMLKEC